MNIGSVINQINDLVYHAIVSRTMNNTIRTSFGICYIAFVYILLLCVSAYTFGSIDVGLFACWIYSICSCPMLAYAAVWGRIYGSFFFLNHIMLANAVLSPFIIPLIIIARNI